MTGTTSSSAPSASVLWTAGDAAAATNGTLHGPDWNATGVSIDSRTVKPGDLFIALTGPNFDGHAYAAKALAAGASAVLVSHRPDDLAGGRARPAGRGHLRRPAGSRLGGAPSRQGQDRRRHRLGRQDQHQGSAGGLPRRAGPDLRHGGQPQQSLGRAAQPRPDAGRQRLCRVRAWHEPCRGDRAAVASGPARCRGHHDDRGGPPGISSARSKPSPTPRPRSSKACRRTGPWCSTATTRTTPGWSPPPGPRACRASWASARRKTPPPG